MRRLSAQKRLPRWPAQPHRAAFSVRSTTASGSGGSAVYETGKAVDEYLQFHYADPSDLLPYPKELVPSAALDFPERCAELCLSSAQRGRALDVGCSVGGMSFQLARHFEEVLAVDFSQAFVDAAQLMAADGERQYATTVSGEIQEMRTARVVAGVERSRVDFEQGDACALRADIGQFDAVLAANLLCRLPNPVAFLARCSDVVKPGGVLALVTPYSWLEEYTPKDQWLGGLPGGPASATVVNEQLSVDFELVSETEMPFLIREHARKFQWGISQATVWRRRE